MQLKLLLPVQVLIDEPVIKVIAEAVDGYFCLLPRHRDFVAALVPGVLSFHDLSGKECFVAVSEGILVKYAGDVMISTLDAALGDELDHLQALVDEKYLQHDEHERKARAALARLESGALKSFKRLQELRHD
ncbi:MAG TPA: F0F1 ATP synthase subunit epsilon [Wenzhouxiangella sp.]|nr:F0F1 ATP synthase subunit epsilon [Wenzhouxiangella sp.]